MNYRVQNADGVGLHPINSVTAWVKFKGVYIGAFLSDVAELYRMPCAKVAPVVFAMPCKNCRRQTIGVICGCVITIR